MTDPGATSISASAWIAGGHRFVGKDGRGIFYRRDGAGPTLVLLHGFPTWSYDYVDVAPRLAGRHQVVAPDFLGYGASDKPKADVYSVAASADMVEGLLASLAIDRARLVIHDYGGIVGQELLDRRRRGVLSFTVDGVHLMNSGVVYAAYRPARIQRLLALPVVGAAVSRLVTRGGVRKGLDRVRGPRHRLRDDEFRELWHGMARDDGHRLAHFHIRYNHERAIHADRWLAALTSYDGPLQLIWGLADPVSGAHVLDALRPLVPGARVDALADVGHFPMAEAPIRVADALLDALPAAQP